MIDFLKFYGYLASPIMKVGPEEGPWQWGGGAMATGGGAMAMGRRGEVGLSYCRCVYRGVGFLLISW